MSALGDARHQARMMRRRVQKKMYRLEVNKNVDWDEPVNRKYHVLPSLDKLDRMNMQQVKASIDKMEKFVSRSTQYYGDVEGRIMDPKKVFKYQNEEKKWIKKSAKEFAKYKDVPAFNGSDKQTVFDLWMQRTPTFGFQDLGNANPLRVKKRDLSHVTSENSLGKLTANLHTKNSNGYFKKLSESHRKETAQMLDKIGTGDAKKLKALIKGLNDQAFNLMWSDARFAQALSMAYAITLSEDMKDEGGDEGVRAHINHSDQDRVDQAMKDARYLLGWAAYYTGTETKGGLSEVMGEYMDTRRTKKGNGRIRRKRVYNTKKNPNTKGHS